MLTAESNIESLTDEQVSAFQRDGFLVKRNLLSPEYVQAILDVTRRDAEAHFGDIEYEADVSYPGAPKSLDAEGGRTIRRLRQAFSRDPVFARLVKEPSLVKPLRQLLTPPVVMPLAHHNCIMTKHPRFSSDTGWHRDVRYWSFRNSNLVNVWFALGSETLENGCLRLIPGSHAKEVGAEQLDDAQFLRPHLQANQPLLETAVAAELRPGDALFFHARCYHSATRNYSDETKYSLVFTFRSLDNTPVEGSRSSELPELLL